MIQQLLSQRGFYQILRFIQSQQFYGVRIAFQQKPYHSRKGGAEMDFLSYLNSSKYDFIRKNPRLGRRIILLGLGGSYAYGTENENSDIDFRGIAMNLPSDLLGLTDFEQYTDDATDTVVYSFNKILSGYAEISVCVRYKCAYRPFSAISSS